MRRVLVTGASGNIGGVVARELLGGALGDVHVIPAASRPLSASLRVADRCKLLDHVAIDYSRPETYEDVLRSELDAVFIVRPGAMGAEDLAAFLEACGSLTKARLVYLSVVGADRSSFIPHNAIERKLADVVGVEAFGAWDPEKKPPVEASDDHDRVKATACIVRANYFFQNMVGAHLPGILDRRVLEVPAGQTRLAMVDARDVGAACATCCVGGSSVDNVVVEASGASAVSFGDCADAISAAIHEPVTYVPTSLPWHWISSVSAGNSVGFSSVTSAIYLAQWLGGDETPSDKLATLLGRPPISLADFAHDYSNVFLHGPHPPPDSAARVLDL